MKASPNCAGLEQGEDAPEGVVAGDGVGQCEQAFAPVALGAAELFDDHKTFRAAEQRADGEDENVVERMALGARAAWVFELAEVLAEADVLEHRKLLPTQGSECITGDWIPDTK